MLLAVADVTQLAPVLLSNRDLIRKIPIFVLSYLCYNIDTCVLYDLLENVIVVKT